MHYLGILLYIASLVSSLIVLIKLFQNKGALHGILGMISCMIYPFIWGWINCKKLSLMKLMLVWTLGGFLGGAFMIPKLLSDSMAKVAEMKAQIEAQQQATPVTQ